MTSVRWKVAFLSTLKMIKLCVTIKGKWDVFFVFDLVNILFLFFRKVATNTNEHQ